MNDSEPAQEPTGNKPEGTTHPRLLMVQEHTGNTAGKLALQNPWTKSQEALDEIRASQHNLGLWRVRSGAPGTHVTPARQTTASDLKIDHAALLEKERIGAV